MKAKKAEEREFSESQGTKLLICKKARREKNTTFVRNFKLNSN
jgi:hypothetical protein